MDQPRNLSIQNLENRVEVRILVLVPHETAELDVWEDVDWHEVLEDFEVELLLDLKSNECLSITICF
jgi:hypothetical protein